MKKRLKQHARYNEEETERVYCEVRTGSFEETDTVLSLKG